MSEVCETLNFNLECVGCKYNLKGLGRDGRCPECGDAVSKSTGAEQLCFSDEGKRKRLRLGLKLMMISPVFLFLTFLAFMFFGFNTFGGGGFGVDYLMILLVFGILFFGYFGFVTYCATRVIEVKEKGQIQRVCGLLWGCFGTFLLLTCGLALQNNFNMGWFIIGYEKAWIVLFFLSGAGFYFFYFTRYLYLARRMESKLLVKFTRVARLVALLILGMILSMVLGEDTFQSMTSTQNYAMLLTFSSGVLVFLTYGICMCYFVLLNRLLDEGEVMGEAIEIGLSERRELEEHVAGALQIGFKCHDCGYNLKSTSADGNCPECGYGIRRTLSGETFMFSDEGWRKRLIAGTWVTFLWPAVIFLVMSGYVVFNMSALLLGGGSNFASDETVFEIIVALIGMGAMVGLTWCAGAKEPGATEENEHNKLRRVMWSMTALTCLFSVVYYGFYYQTINSQSLVPESLVTLGSEFLLMGISAIYLLTLGSRYRVFAKRMERKRLAKYAQSQRYVQMMVLGACVIGLFDLITGRAISVAIFGAQDAETVSVICYGFGMVMMSLGGLQLFVLNITMNIALTSSLDEGRVREQFIPEVMARDEVVYVETEQIGE